MAVLDTINERDADPQVEAESRWGADSALEADDAWEDSVGHPAIPARWMGWRLRLLVLMALLGCVAVFLLARHLADQPLIGGQWRADAAGRLELVSSARPELKGFEGGSLIGLVDRDGSRIELDGTLLQRSQRWLVNGAERRRHAALHDALYRAAADGGMRFLFVDGRVARLEAPAPGLLGLGALFWLMCGLGLLLYLVAMVVLLARPSLRNGLYAIMSMSQAASLGFIAAESLPGLNLPAGLAGHDYALRTALDLVTVAAVVHATSLPPLPSLWRNGVAGVVWAGVGALIAAVTFDGLSNSWWWTQATLIAFGLLSIGQMLAAYRQEPHPATLVVRRLATVAVGILVLLTASIAAADRLPASPYQVAATGSIVWVVFLSSLLGVLPFLSRSQQTVREFSMLAGVSTVATSLDLLFVTAFSLSPFASLTLSLFLSLGVYIGVRQWILDQLMGSNMLTTERMFEQLYRIARDVEARPERIGIRLSSLLRELYEPLEVLQMPRELRRSRVTGDGSTLLVPVPVLAGAEPASSSTVALRFAHRGKRLFTVEDARLTDRVVEQLKRAVAYDRAVELGRSEERVRLAQDLHDDIGARLLTLMYKAPDPEMEEYLRHTLQDLKTLTRGLAAANHRLSHAAAEWKSDLTQRLNAAQCDLGWSFSADGDVVLSVVHWSALTRILRELVSNAIAHAEATRLGVEAVFEGGTLTLVVSDNGCGRNPQAWAHGLGLGGIRKRVKQLGGEVSWRENAPAGIVCRVVIRGLHSAS